MKKFIVIALYVASFIALYSGLVTAAASDWSDAGVAALLASLVKAIFVLSFTIVVKAAFKYLESK